LCGVRTEPSCHSRAEGKIVVLSFWATCVAVQRTRTGVQSRRRVLRKDADAVFLAVNVDDDETLVRRFSHTKSGRAVVYADAWMIF